MFPELSSAAYSSRQNHPGTVTFVDTDGTERPEPADQIPDWLKFAPGADGAAVPVVRIARVPGTRGYNLRSFGADGKLLWDFDTAKAYSTVNGVAGKGGSLDGAGPVIAGGMVFVNSGYPRFGGAPGNVLLAFAVEPRPR